MTVRVDTGLHFCCVFCFKKYARRLSLFNNVAMPPRQPWQGFRTISFELVIMILPYLYRSLSAFSYLLVSFDVGDLQRLDSNKTQDEKYNYVSFAHLKHFIASFHRNNSHCRKVACMCIECRYIYIYVKYRSKHACELELSVL